MIAIAAVNLIAIFVGCLVAAVAWWVSTKIPVPVLRLIVQICIVVFACAWLLQSLGLIDPIVTFR